MHSASWNCSCPPCEKYDKEVKGSEQILWNVQCKTYRTNLVYRILKGPLWSYYRDMFAYHWRNLMWVFWEERKQSFEFERITTVAKIQGWWHNSVGCEKRSACANSLKTWAVLILEQTWTLDCDRSDELMTVVEWASFDWVAEVCDQYLKASWDLHIFS